MKDIRFWVRFVSAMLMLTLLCGTTQWGMAQIDPDKVVIDGKVTFKIEKKYITKEQAQTYITNHTPIPLKLSVIFEGGFVDYIQARSSIYFNQGSISFGIAQKDGRDKITAPLESTNPLAWIYGSSCTSGGLDLTAPEDGTFYTAASWSEYCPRPFAYSAVISLNQVNNASTSPYCQPIYNEGQIVAYELDLFNLYFGLKPDFLNDPNLYIRGIDCNSGGLASTDDQLALGGTSLSATEFNIVANRQGKGIVWPRSQTSSALDWTESGSSRFGGDDQIETDYYGGVIPGGIFIEQVPELTQFERSFMA